MSLLNGSVTGNPIGTIISLMGITAPAGYLACNGQTVNIADWPDLAEYFEVQFGSKNYFGGNGTTTFKIPDLRGEFLRGTGTNGHSGQGNGATVGTHQDATEIPNVGLWAPSASQAQFHIEAFQAGAANTTIMSAGNQDALFDHTPGHRYWIQMSSTNISDNTSHTTPDRYAARPTNTCVLYCIKAVQ